MRGLPDAEKGPTTRTRRWDAVILGGALPGLVAASRLGMSGARVLVLEEEAAVQRFPGLREPFWISGAQQGSVLGACLRALAVPLIDRRRLEPDPLAFQLVWPDARLDVGEPGITVDEWVAWGLAKPDEARTLARRLAEAAAAECAALLESGFVRGSRRLARSARHTGEAPAEPGPRGARGLPAELREAPPRLARALEQQLRVLSNLAAATPEPAAQARLLGAPFEGGAEPRGDSWLRDILRRRVESLYGEFRTLPETFRLVSAGGQPGVAPDAAGESGEIWVARAFVLNAPLHALGAAVAQGPVPEVLRAPAPPCRRVSLHLRVDGRMLPEAMASRVILVADPSRPPRGDNCVTLRRFGAGDGRVDLVATAVAELEEAGSEALLDRIEGRVRGLLPFAGDALRRVPDRTPRWDDEGLLADPPSAAGWPAEVSVRLGTKQPIYHLDRSRVAGLGCEGELLLGWRGGDAIAGDLA